MQVTNINYTPNFQARIRIQKKGFQNLLKDFRDSAALGVRGTGSVSSSVAETTSFPSDLASERNALSEIMHINEYAMQKESARISARNIRTSQLENTQGLKKTAESSGYATTGTTTVASGLGSYYSAGAAALDQSVHYPNALFPGSAAEYAMQSSGGRFAHSVDHAQWSAYDSLYNEHGAGNESASSFSTIASGSGAFLQALGSTFIRGKEAVEKLGAAQKNIPS